MLSSLDISIIRKVQEDIPIVPEPYKKIAEELGISQEDLLNKIIEFSNKGIIRRFGAILNHRNAGFNANAMVVWKVPEESIKEITDIMIEFREISHCYRRPVCDDWPYNIFTMIHGQTKNICEDIVQKISELSNIKDYNILYSIYEFKKSSMKYFQD
ncbi:transcriptional regulator, AsnC family [Clostridium pasteurianum DSM 525 = ATCC 6013]|uniref:siroheme decarboxylase n=1 Tax=Clostridium pasteurianum DSM 525 = ATCC 6013 TaxID=1262449 RepID=A0A0H3IYF9_CLOPA|nr:Lrp/AsnC family transcriptional regulator [Clostridium pasteurianum]AJA46546.1 transcriptional regulator, AsnC family [Clostridium pasteurianum DSM 525 = ATCC 6013]AJA50534.1 transcriptional regulator, AsnC family [Clostridium pasteurianum DSM 525 = ATCC 6013]AOZ73970.1 transcriptional regulator [Clostridium pasteurianum DSM 525 = ATCC 6013]AOZ77767.1 transcriptional regulator [Clostridium pasteurianum]ELP61118.1 Transcriptional regulator, Lrp family protein [Clostridium pasteurianum DSM 52